MDLYVPPAYRHGTNSCGQVRKIYCRGGRRRGSAGKKREHVGNSSSSPFLGGKRLQREIPSARKTAIPFARERGKASRASAWTKDGSRQRNATAVPRLGEGRTVLEEGVRAGRTRQEMVVAGDFSKSHWLKGGKRAYCCIVDSHPWFTSADGKPGERSRKRKRHPGLFGSQWWKAQRSRCQGCRINSTLTLEGRLESHIKRDLSASRAR